MKDNFIIRDCSKCKFSIKKNNFLYCELRLKDYNSFFDSAKVDFVACGWFKDLKKE